MPKPGKRYYSDAERQRLIREYAPYLNSLHVPTEAVRAVIRALLEKIPVPNLNVDAAEGHLMADLLHDNRELAEAKKRSEDYASEDLSPEDVARAEQELAAVVCGGRGSRRLEQVLEEYSSHSIVRMRQESDEILAAIEASLTPGQFRSKWIDLNLPNLLQFLKQKHACFLGCKPNTKWPPQNEEYRDRMISPEEGMGPASLKNEILAYFHKLSVLRVRDYLEGKRPKTQSRSLRRS